MIFEDFHPKRKTRIMKKFLAREQRKPFHLEKDLLLRSIFIQENDEDYILITTFHHIAFDGWSIHIFYHELSNIYGFLTNQNPLNIPELKIQYADYAKKRGREGIRSSKSTILEK